MRDRSDVVVFIDRQLSMAGECTREKKGRHHYGLQELRELLDWLYGEPPQKPSERLKGGAMTPSFFKGTTR